MNSIKTHSNQSISKFAKNTIANNQLNVITGGINPTNIITSWDQVEY